MKPLLTNRNSNKTRKSNGFRFQPAVKQIRTFLQWQGEAMSKMRQLVTLNKAEELDVFLWVQQKVHDNEDKGAKYRIVSDDGNFVVVAHPSDDTKEYSVDTRRAFWTCPCGQPQQKFVFMCLRIASFRLYICLYNACV
jgi:hypothetical protein